MNAAGYACLSDIGFATIARDEESESSPNKVGLHASRRLAPEIITNGERSEKSDIFSYGFVAAEVRRHEAYLCHRHQPPLDIPGRAHMGSD